MSSSSSHHHHLISLFPSPTHPAIPTAIQILTSLRSSSTSSTLGLSNGEIVALPGISAILACERLNQTDSLSLQTIQKLSSTTPKLFLSGLAKCRTYLASSERKTPTKRRYQTDGVQGGTPPNSLLGIGESSTVRTPPSAKRGLDLSGLKRSSQLPISTSTSSQKNPNSGSSFTAPTTHSITPAAREELEERDETNRTPTKNRMVDVIGEFTSIQIDRSAEKQNHIPSRSTEALPYSLPEVNVLQPQSKRSRTRTPQTFDLPISPYISIPHPQISLMDVIGGQGGIYEPPSHPEDGFVFRKMCPPPPSSLPSFNVGTEDIEEGDDRDQDESVKHEYRANHRRHKRMETIRRGRNRTGDRNGRDGVDIGWDTSFFVGLGMGGRKVEGEREMWEGLGEDNEERMGENVVGWEERIDHYVDIFPCSLDPSSISELSQPSPALDTTASSDTSATKTPSRRRRILPSVKKQLSALQAAKAAQQNAERKEMEMREIEGRRWLGRAEMRGIAVRVWVDEMTAQ